MYYGMNHVESWRRAASYVDRILKGTKPNDLPFEEISRFDLVINLREANALGLERFARSLKPTGRELPDLCPDDSI